MFKVKIIAIAAAVAVTAAVCYTRIAGSENDIMSLHPEIDSKTIRKAHRRFLRDAMTGAIDLPSTDDAIDDVFMKNYIQPLI